MDGFAADGGSAHDAVEGEGLRGDFAGSLGDAGGAPIGLGGDRLTLGVLLRLEVGGFLLDLGEGLGGEVGAEGCGGGASLSEGGGGEAFEDGGADAEEDWGGGRCRRRFSPAR